MKKDRNIAKDRIVKCIDCYDVCINFNWYFVGENVVGRSNVWISVEKVEAEISKDIQRCFLRMGGIF